MSASKLKRFWSFREKRDKLTLVKQKNLSVKTEGKDESDVCDVSDPIPVAEVKKRDLPKVGKTFEDVKRRSVSMNEVSKDQEVDDQPPKIPSHKSVGNLNVELPTGFVAELKRKILNRRSNFEV